MRELRKLVFGETVALPVGVALVLAAGLALEALAGSWWEEAGGFVAARARGGGAGGLAGARPPAALESRGHRQLDRLERRAARRPGGERERRCARVEAQRQQRLDPVGPGDVVAIAVPADGLLVGEVAGQCLLERDTGPRQLEQPVAAQVRALLGLVGARGGRCEEVVGVDEPAAGIRVQDGGAAGRYLDGRAGRRPRPA